ncbi:hypothetical protein J7E49_22410 [Variovorax paradoxus]|nr:hypothetical protein [Variovorax paradoxus]
MVDIPFAFGDVARARTMTGFSRAPCEGAANIVSALVAFARTGDSNNARMPERNPYDTNRRATMVIDEHCRVVNDLHGADRVAGAPATGVVPTTLLRGSLFRGTHDGQTSGDPAPPHLSDGSEAIRPGVDFVPASAAVSKLRKREGGEPTVLRY